MANVVLKSRLKIFSFTRKYKKSKLILHVKPGFKLACKKRIVAFIFGYSQSTEMLFVNFFT